MDAKYTDACKGFACDSMPFVTERLKALGPCRLQLSLPGNCKQLFRNRLNDVQVVALCQALQGERINSLTLDYNLLGNTAAKAVAQLLQARYEAEDADAASRKHRGLVELHLRSNHITAEGATVLADALSHPGCTLQHLVLSHNALGDDGVTAIAQALQENTSLQHLDLSNTEVSEKGVISLAVALADHNRTLQSLLLSSPLLQQRPQHDTLVHLARMLACSSSLQELHLAKAGLTDDALKGLVQYGLLKSKSLQHLDLSANRFSNLAGPYVQQLLSAKACSIRSLNISSNRLQDQAAQSIAACIPSCTVLEQLDLSNCSIGDSGLCALLSAVSQGPKLQVLKLSGNTFGAGSSQTLHLLRQQQGREGLVPDVTTYVVDGVAHVAAQ